MKSVEGLVYRQFWIKYNILLGLCFIRVAHILVCYYRTRFKQTGYGTHHIVPEHFVQ